MSNGIGIRQNTNIDLRKGNFFILKDLISCYKLRNIHHTPQLIAETKLFARRKPHHHGVRAHTSFYDGLHREAFHIDDMNTLRTCIRPYSSVEICFDHAVQCHRRNKVPLVHTSPTEALSPVKERDLG